MKKNEEIGANTLKRGSANHGGCEFSPPPQNKNKIGGCSEGPGVLGVTEWEKMTNMGKWDGESTSLRAIKPLLTTATREGRVPDGKKNAADWEKQQLADNMKFRSIVI